jgi:Bacteriophage terminase large (ATPase) subunit and inactivated derivatives
MDSTEERLVQLLGELKEREKFWRIKQYTPYGWQEKFLAASSNCQQILAMTGNRCGKTYTGGYAVAVHLTGLYPVWWTGKRFDNPIEAWAAGISTDTTRDILQSELLGDWKNPEKFGTGAIPKELIVDVINKPQVPGAVQSVLVRHISGGISTLDFKSYEMSQDKFMGTAKHVIWLDEECPSDIFTQCVTRTATTGGLVLLTFTPEHGLTEIVKNFMYELKPGQFMITASWDDAPHLDDKVKEQLMSVFTPAERAMRVSGQPSLGSGVVFPILEEKISCDPFEIPEHWMRIIGIDLGMDHPNAVACIAWDNENDKFYLYDEYSQRGETLSMHATAIRGKGGATIPVVVPHDAFKRDGLGSGKQIIKLLQEDHGLNVVMEPFSNPPAPDGKAGGNSVESGIAFMMTAMEEDRFKVFNTCTKFLQETKLYHRVDGKIIDKGDDMISATRYAVLMAGRHARPGSHKDNSAYYFDSKQPLTPSWYSEIV